MIAAGTIAQIQSRRAAERKQLQLLNSTDGWHETIRSKLQGRLNTIQFENFQRCGTEKIYRTCKGCGKCDGFGYHCMIKWCPRCNWRVTNKRQEMLERWSQLIDQPKHVVTTQRNTATLTRKMISDHTRNLAKLRRANVFKEVKGGCVSVEITNESRGWHLHAHWFVDARWIDASELSSTWARLVGQDFAIVKVLDLRSRKDFAREVAKYVVKGSEMATWDGNEINEFVRAVRGRRFFFAFGTLFRASAKIRAEMNAEKIPTVCECGCEKFVVRSAVDELLHEIRTQQRKR